MTTKEKMTAFLRGISKYHSDNGISSTEAVLLNRGLWFEGRRHSDDYQSAKAWKRNAEPKHCFANSQHYCTEDNGARYFEGYALINAKLEPFEHAWIVMADGGIVDFTLELMEVEALKQELMCNTSGTAYVGISIPSDFVSDSMLINRGTEPLLELFLAENT